MQTLRVEHNDTRIAYGNGIWISEEISDRNGGLTRVQRNNGPGGRFFILFRGTGFRFYGGGSGRMHLAFDDGLLVSTRNSPNTPGGSPVLELSDLEDTDHHLLVLTEGDVFVDHFILESSTGNGFEPISSGPNATDVPTEAILVEDTDPSIILNPANNFYRIQGAGYHGPSLLNTRYPGSSITYTFQGVAIWLYTDFHAPHGNALITIDNETEDLVSTSIPQGQSLQQLFYRRTALRPNVNHTLRIEHKAAVGQYVTLDFMRILKSEDEAALEGYPTTNSTFPFTPPKESGPPPGSDENRRYGLGRITLILYVLLAVIAFIMLGLIIIMLLIRRRKRKEKKDKKTVIHNGTEENGPAISRNPVDPSRPFHMAQIYPMALRSTPIASRSSGIPSQYAVPSQIATTTPTVLREPSGRSLSLYTGDGLSTPDTSSTHFLVEPRSPEMPLHEVKY